MANCGLPRYMFNQKWIQPHILSLLLLAINVKVCGKFSWFGMYYSNHCHRMIIMPTLCFAYRGVCSCSFWLQCIQLYIFVNIRCILWFSSLFDERFFILTLYRLISQLLEDSKLAFALKEQYLNHHKCYDHDRQTVGNVFSLRICWWKVLRKTFSNS